jgi:NAD(P) transhydrogenase subunit alpha
MDFVTILSIFVLACFVGYFVVWSVTPALHTPLMAVTNAISSVIIVGALIAAAASGNPVAKWLGLAGVVLASVNIFGGFAVTARMLAIVQEEGALGWRSTFRRRPPTSASPPTRCTRSTRGWRWPTSSAGACFIIALRGLSSPATSQRGNRFGMIGMAIAVVTTLVTHVPGETVPNDMLGFEPTHYFFLDWASLGEILAAIALGAIIGLTTAKRIQMTAMPQLVAAFHSLVGLAAVLVAAGRVRQPGGLRHPRARRQHPRRQPDRDGARRRDRRDHLLGLGDRLRQAQRQHVGRADPAARAARDQPRHARAILGLTAILRHRARRGPGRGLGVLGARRARLRDRLPADHPDRRGGHAGRGVDAQLVLGLGGGGDGLHAAQHRDDHHRRAGRQLGRDPQLHHVPGDEPQLHLGDRRRLRRRGERGGEAKEQRPYKQGSAEDARSCSSRPTA